jgi:hypothetical protein
MIETTAGVRRTRRDRLSYQSETPFDSIESSHQYVVMLSDAIAEAMAEVESDIALASTDHAERRKQALQLVSFNLSKLHAHIHSSSRILNDLRTLRRLLLEERIMVRRAGHSA